MTSTNQDANANTRRPRKCGLCGLTGHNMTTCIRLRFHQNQVHRLYVHMWQRWIETMNASLTNHEPRFFDDNPSDYLSYANMISLENDVWLKQLRNFRLLKSYLNLSKMRVMGFNLEKVNIERFKDNPENLKYNTKIDISNIESLNSNFIKIKDEMIKISFKYNVTYEPEYAKLEIAGNLLLAVEPKLSRDVLREWKDKKISEDFRLTILNIIIRKSSIKALQLEDELGLPPHLPFPILKKQESNEASQ